nr:hypothetical protein Iba_chr03cCG3350 [Ipomoea batatas]
MARQGDANIFGPMASQLTASWIQEYTLPITKEKTKGQHHQQPSTAAGVILLRLWGSLREKRGEGDLMVETPPLQIYRAFRDEPTRTNIDRSNRQNGAHAPVAAPLPPAASPLHSDQNPLPTHSTSL